MSPGNSQRLFRLGELCSKTRDQEQARKYFQESHGCGHAKHQEALRCHETALNLAPASEMIYFQLGLLYFDLGGKDQALQAFQTALRLRPDFADVREFIRRHLLHDLTPGGPDLEIS